MFKLPNDFTDPLNKMHVKVQGEILPNDNPMKDVFIIVYFLNANKSVVKIFINMFVSFKVCVHVCDTCYYKILHKNLPVSCLMLQTLVGAFEKTHKELRSKYM